MGRRLDALIAATVPNVRKAVKWNSPFYGADNDAKTWFLSSHCFTIYIKVAFFRGASLHPLPPNKSKQNTCLLISGRTTRSTKPSRRTG